MIKGTQKNTNKTSFSCHLEVKLFENIRKIKIVLSNIPKIQSKSTLFPDLSTLYATNFTIKMSYLVWFLEKSTLNPDLPYNRLLYKRFLLSIFLGNTIKLNRAFRGRRRR